MTILFLVIEAVANVATIGLQQILIDNVLLQGEQHLLWKTILLITLAFLVQVVMFTLGPHFIHLSVAAVTEHVSKDFIQYMYRIPTRTLQKKEQGSLCIISFLMLNRLLYYWGMIIQES